MRKFEFKLDISNLTAVPTDIISKLIASKDSDAALAFLYILRYSGSIEPSQMCLDTGFNEGRLDSAIACILRTGYMTELREKAETVSAPRIILPEVSTATYTPEELSRGLREDPMFKWLCHEAEAQLGRILRQFELETLYSIYDYLSMPAEVVIMLIGYLVSLRNDRTKRGLPAQAVSFQQISREASHWCDMGINTAEKADAHIKKLMYRQTVIGKVQYSLGIRDRSPSPSEQKYINTWLDANLTPELIAKAYDITVLQRGNLNWPYMNSIIKRWIGCGYHTVADMEANERRGAVNGSDAPPQAAVDSDYASRVMRHISAKQTDKED